MPLPVPHPGLVICYSYLWHSEAAKGKLEGVKNRPCAIVLATQDEDDDTVVTVVPITHTPPQDLDVAIEIPIPTKERLGLDNNQSWIAVNEINRFVWPGPDLRAISRKQPVRYDYGVLPPGLFKQLKEKLVRIAKQRKLKPVQRTE